MATNKRQRMQPDWVSKTLAGVLLGLTLGLAASGIVSELTRPMALPTRGQLAMWAVCPVWMVAAGAVYFFATGRRAWLWLLAANAVAFGAFWVLRSAA